MSPSIYSSRAGDEDFEDAEDVGLEYFMQRHAAAFGLGNSAESAVADSTNTSSAAERYASGLRNALGRGGFTAEHLLELAGGFGSTGSPSRDEIYAARTGAGVRGFSVRGTVEEGGAALSNASKLGNRSHAVRSNDLNRNISTNALTDLGLDETKSSCTWNADLMYPSVLIGQYTSRRRHDIDKQEVLSQVSELELQDMLPIIASCEFALCVYYARAILVRGMSTFLEVGGDGENSYRTSVELEIESKNAALLGTCSAGSTFLEYLVSCGSAMTLKLLKCLFKQSVLVSSQSDRILPWIVNGNVAGDPRDRVPPFSPFQNTSVSCLSIILSKLELRLFSGSLSTMATEESSLQSTSALSAYIKSLLDLLECSSSVSDTAVENSGTSPYRLSSSMSELQGQALRAVGFEIEMPSRQSNMLSSVRKTLWFLVENALSDLERASSTKYDTCDWIYHGIDKEECVDDLFPIMVSNGDTAVVKDSPCVLLSYWFIRSLLILSKVQKETEVDIKLRDNYQKFREEFASSIAHDELLKGNPIAMLTSADTLSRLLKVSMCQNLTLRYCVWDLCSWILFRVNVILTVAMHQIPNRFPEFSQTSGGLSASNSDLQVPQLIAVEYYIAIAKEKRQLQIFGTRMKTELIDRKLLSRYTRATSMFLFQWQVLRRRLGLCSHNYVDDYLTSCSRYYNIDEYKKIVQGELEKSTITGADNSSCEYIRITQISPSSITVSWMLRPARDGELSKDDSSLYFTAASHVGLESPILVLSNLDRVGTFRIDDLESGMWIIVTQFIVALLFVVLLALYTAVGFVHDK